MVTRLKIRDEAGPGALIAEFSLDLDKEWISVGDFIRERIRREVDAYNAEPCDVYQGLVQPDDAERQLNNFKMRTRRKIDPEDQIERALRAFEANQILILVDDYQVGQLDEMIEVGATQEVTFLRLVPLVGG